MIEEVLVRVCLCFLFQYVARAPGKEEAGRRELSETDSRVYKWARDQSVTKEH